MLLIKNADVIAPESIGIQDILIAGGKIIAVESHIEASRLDNMVETVDLDGRMIMPGIIDQHVHITGGGGEDSFRSRTPAVKFTDIITCGVTSVVGLLGTDGLSRSIEDLLAKAHALEEEGISCWVHTGSYRFPSTTLTGDIAKDIAFIDKVLGVKIAMSDHRSSNPSAHDLVKLGTNARVAGLLSGKSGIVHIHVGSGKNALKPLFEALEMSDLPARQFSPTHLSRNPELFKEAIDFARCGGMIDLTADSGSNVQGFSVLDAIEMCPSDLRHALTISSDGNGSFPTFDSSGSLISIGVASQNTLLRTLTEILTLNLLSTSEAVSLFTANVADNLGISKTKGRIRPGMDADLVSLDKSFDLDSVIAKGKWMVRSKQLLTSDYYRQSS